MITHRSITRDIVILFFISVAVMTAAYFALSGYINRSYFFTDPVVDLMEQETDKNPLASDQFERIDSKTLAYGEILVYDGQGKLLYASDKGLKSALTKADLALLPDDDSDYYWTVSENPKDANRRYIVCKMEDIEDSDRPQILGFAVLDEDYRIVEGNLFKGKKRLNDHELEMLEGRYRGYELQTFHYKTKGKETRMLVYLQDESKIDQQMEVNVDRAQRMWLWLLPVLLLIILLWLVMLRRMLRQYLLPLNAAVVDYGKGNRARIETDKLPTELAPLAESFNGMADRLENMNEEKEQAHRDRQTLIADISHDLRTPLTVIQGYSQAFLEGKVPQDKQMRYMETIHEKADASSEMLEMLLDYSRLEHPEFTVTKSDVDLAEVCRVYLAEKYEELQLAGIPLSAEIPEEPIRFPADPALLSRLFDNLIDNSVKHNPDPAPIFFTLRANPEKIRITVGDDGVGIPAPIRESVFAPFVTGSVARTEAKGAGLGMAIAKKAAELHGGTLRLLPEGTDGHSVVFEILFPREAGAETKK